ncbi:MAG: TonB-dependent receptor plug domain-containing protein [Saprospiraceae bacterium]|nr:TonB-dependent receptor plug domain-containing protein [Saprospiraceae bacterium]
MSSYASGYLLLALLYLSGSLFAQSGSLILRVLDEETGYPLEFATATLLHAADSMVVSGGITGQDGRVELPVDKGRYLIKIDFIAYTSRMIGPVELDQGERRDMGSVNIYPEAALLSEIEVSAEKTQMQLKLDKKVYNVGKDIANSGSTAAEILDNVPSVTVDVEGNVSLRGSQGVRILIDGRPSGLIGIGDSDGLRSLPSNLIDRIEVITNPSARYEAEGMAGIINIVLKKERQEGVNGSFETTLGWPYEWGGAANVNYRRSMVNLFANYGIRYRSGPGRGTQYQEFYRNDSIFINDQIREHERKSLSHNIRLGMDLFIGKESTLTSSFNYRYSQDDNLTRLTYRDYLEDLQHPTWSPTERMKKPNWNPPWSMHSTGSAPLARKIISGPQMSDIRIMENKRRPGLLSNTSCQTRVIRQMKTCSNDRITWKQNDN